MRNQTEVVLFDTASTNYDIVIGPWVGPRLEVLPSSGQGQKRRTAHALRSAALIERPIRPELLAVFTPWPTQVRFLPEVHDFWISPLQVSAGRGSGDFRLERRWPCFIVGGEIYA